MRHTEKTTFARSIGMRPITLARPCDINGRGATAKSARAETRNCRNGAPFEIGRLSEDPPTLAARIANACAYGSTTVWVDDECRVHCTKTEAPPMPIHWIIGIYTCGVSLKDVVDDLRHERTQRERVWLLA